MNLVETDIVKPADSRPVGPPGRCTYCREPIGSAHRAECVIVSKTVVMEFTLRVVMDVPREWSETNIHFRYNDSSWCADNLLEALGAWAERSNDEGGAGVPCGCSCAAVEARFLRDATADDHAAFPVLISE